MGNAPPEFKKMSDYWDFDKITKFALRKSCEYLNSQLNELQKYCTEQLEKEDLNIIEQILAAVLKQNTVTVLDSYKDIQFNYVFNIEKEFYGITIKSFKLTNPKNSDTGKRETKALFSVSTELKIAGSTAKSFGMNLSTDELIYPEGMGLALAAPLFEGGGYIDVDMDKGYYAGMFEIAVIEKIDATATVVLMTKTPDGKDRISLFAALSGIFSPPIQLGYGFALNGIGGLIGLNRRIDMGKLEDEMVKNKNLNKLMFPEDPIKNAPVIISMIDNVFPPESGYHVFGPFVKIIWGGAVKLVEFNIGVFVGLKLTSLENILLLGTARVQLPNEEAEIIRLNMDVVGSWDLGNKEFFIYGSLYDSKILKKFDVKGDMLFLVRYGKDSVIVFSAGGYHPRWSEYNKDLTATLPSMQRLYFGLIGKNKKFELTSYMAITTNSFQFGAKAYIWLKFGPIRLDGNLGFDTLIQFSPLFFDVRILFGAHVKWKSHNLLGLDVTCNLTGPNQYHAWGVAKFDILWWTIEEDFDKKWGKKEKEEIEYVKPSETLRSELKKNNVEFIPQKWKYEGVIFTEDADEKMSAYGDLVFKQELIPLNEHIERYSGKTVEEDEQKLDLVVSETQYANIESHQKHPESKFMPKDFKIIDEDDINAPPFFSAKNGVRVRGGGKIPKIMDDVVVCYETILINPKDLVEDEGAIEKSVLAKWLAKKKAERKAKKIRKIQRQRRKKGVKTALTAKHPSTKTIDIHDGKLPAHALMKKVFAFQSKQYHKPIRSHADKTNKNYIHVEEPSYTVTENNVSGGKFKRVEIGGKTAQNMSYFEAKRIIKKKAMKNATVKSTVYASPKGGN